MVEDAVVKAALALKETCEAFHFKLMDLEYKFARSRAGLLPTVVEYHEGETPTKRDGSERG